MLKKIIDRTNPVDGPKENDLLAFEREKRSEITQQKLKIRKDLENTGFKYDEQ